MLRQPTSSDTHTVPLLVFLGPEFYRRLSQSRMEQVLENAIRVEFLGSGLAPLNDDELRRVQAPMLLVGGQCSPRLFGRLLDRLGELLPNSKRIEIGAASHIMHEDNGIAYNAAVQSFLAVSHSMAD